MSDVASLARTLSADGALRGSVYGLTSILRTNAMAEDVGTGDIAVSIALLRETSVMRDDGTADPERTARNLMHLGAANLSVGRLIEGHINALYLATAHGSERMIRTVRSLVASGALLGVWGADDSRPVTVDEATGRLSGAKKFASGLGVVTHAVVSVTCAAGARLALVDVTDPSRQDAARWRMPGMRATASGTFDFEGMTVSPSAWIGAPGDYYREPHFVGGVWRIAALQIGAAIGLVDCAAHRLRAMDRFDAPAQKARLGQLTIRALAGAAQVDRAALTAAREATEDAEDAVATSIAARLLTEDIALDTIAGVEQSLGLAHFEAGSETGRMARDLSVYLRQAARDALLSRFAEHALAGDGSVWRLVR